MTFPDFFFTIRAKSDSLGFANLTMSNQRGFSVPSPPSALRNDDYDDVLVQFNVCWLVGGGKNF